MLDYRENGPTLRYNPNIRINYSDKQSNIDSNVTPDIEDYIETPYYVVNDLQNESKTIGKSMEDATAYNNNSEKYSKPIKDSGKKVQLQPKPEQTIKSECNLNINKSRNLTENKAVNMEGKVLDADTCNPISGATISLFRKYKNCDDKLVGKINTNVNGEYTFMNVIPGIYVIQIAAQCYKSRCICIAMIKNFTPLENTTTLKKDGSCSNSNSCIFGIINDANKKPMCNAKVVLSKINGDNTYTNVALTTTNNCGKYTFTNVSNGNYKVIANDVDVSSVSIDGSCKKVQIYNN